MTIKGDGYCLGYGLSDKCKSCQNEKNWLELNEMPHNWRKNAQSKMNRVDGSACGLYGGVFYISSEA